jgi:ribonucleotide reductase beta subunit family protein with ferritin-like domain
MENTNVIEIKEENKENLSLYATSENQNNFKIGQYCPICNEFVEGMFFGHGFWLCEKCSISLKDLILKNRGINCH